MTAVVVDEKAIMRKYSLTFNPRVVGGYRRLLAVRLKHNKPSRTHPRQFFLKNDISLPTTFYGFLFRLLDG